jgi:uncharacterized protein YhdP
MARKRLKQILFIAVGVFVILPLVISLGLRLFYPSAKLRRLVETQIQQATQRQAQIGDIQLSLWGIGIDRFKLSEVPSLSSGTFVAVNRMSVRWAILPLLSRHVAIQTVTLENPQIFLIRRANGQTLNISDLTDSTSAKATVDKRGKPGSPAEASAKAWTWSVDAIRLKDGRIAFDDQSPARQSSTLSHIDLTIRDFDPTRVQGQLTVGQLDNPVYHARDFYVQWNLHEMDPSLAHLTGSCKLTQGTGSVQNLDKLVSSSKAARVALMPLVMLQSLDKLGFVKLGLPEFSHLDILKITGDYDFKDGTMKINSSEIDGPQMNVKSRGTIELASGQLAVDVALHTPKPVLLGEMDLKMQIGGTLSDPKTNLDSLKKKAFKATVKTLMDKPGVQKGIDDTLKKIFH